MIDIAEVQAISAERAVLWHQPEGLEQWSSLEWAGAMCGEAGEAANVAKKLRRYELEIYNKGGSDYQPLDKEELLDKYGKELSDTFLYLVLCAARVGINLEREIVVTFNNKSREAGFPQRLLYNGQEL